MQDNQFYAELDLLKLGDIGFVFEDKDLQIKSEDHEKALNLALNKISGEWDNEKLRVLLEDLELSPINIELTGFDEPELEELDVNTHDNAEVVEDDYEEPEELETDIKHGDLFRLGNHYLCCGDSTIEEDVERLLTASGKRERESIDLTFTDPPYNALKSWKAKEAKSKTRLNPNEWFENDNMSWEEYTIFLDKFFKQILGHSVYICCDFRIYPIILEALAKTPYDLKHCIVWKKNIWGLGKRYRFQHEFIVYACKENAPFEGDRSQSDVWEIDVDRTTKHNTPKPVPLPAKAIKNSTRPSQNVLDLFGGSGSTLIACEQTNRNCYMMELSPRYCQTIINRWEEFTGEKAEQIT